MMPSNHLVFCGMEKSKTKRGLEEEMGTGGLAEGLCLTGVLALGRPGSNPFQPLDHGLTVTVLYLSFHICKLG